MGDHVDMVREKLWVSSSSISHLTSICLDDFDIPTGCKGETDIGIATVGGVCPYWDWERLCNSSKTVSTGSWGWELGIVLDWGKCNSRQRRLQSVWDDNLSGSSRLLGSKMSKWPLYSNSGYASGHRWKYVVLWICVLEIKCKHFTYFEL